jgi:hypothetical protein
VAGKDIIRNIVSLVTNDSTDSKQSYVVNGVVMRMTRDQVLTMRQQGSKALPLNEALKSGKRFIVAASETNGETVIVSRPRRRQ